MPPRRPRRRRRSGDLLQVIGAEQPMAPVGAAHVYGHRFLSTPETHDRADHASPVGDRVEIVYLYLDAYARFFRACYELDQEWLRNAENVDRKDHNSIV
jgi:hypothetical protein